MRNPGPLSRLLPALWLGPVKTRVDGISYLLGVETVDSTPEQFGHLLRSEIAKWGKVVKTLKISAE